MTTARIALPLVLALAAAATLPRDVAAAEGTIVIKLGTVAPAGSKWERVLAEMGQQWRDASGGLVKLQIYAGGVAGDESDLVRGMGIGKQQAASLTVVGLSNIVAEPQALCVPQLLTSNEELDYVRGKLTPELDAKIAKRGYTVLHWADAGWLRFFSTKPFTHPDAMKPMKIFVWTGETGSIEIWKDRGYKPVPLAATDITLSLQSGLIDVVPMTALMALSTQSNLIAKYVIDYRWAPLVGATIVRTETWERIPADMRPKLLAIAAEAGEKLRKEVRQLDDDAITSMRSKGLIIQTVTPEEATAWAKLAENAHARIRAEVVDPASFDEVKRLRDEFRASRAGGAPQAAPGAQSPAQP